MRGDGDLDDDGCGVVLRPPGDREIDEGVGGRLRMGGILDHAHQVVVGHDAVYLAAIGGAAALIAQCVESAEVVAFEELGTEAVRKLKVRNFPAVVAIDRFGNNIYNT